MEESDLVALAARGRVRFYEANEYLLWQGEPHKPHVFVIQQGTVSLWDETGGRATLRDVRGPGDMLGLERYTDAPGCLHTAMSDSDVVFYAFPSEDVDALVQKYPYARAFVESDDAVTTDYEWAQSARDPHALFLHEAIGPRALNRCAADASIRDVARQLVATGADAVAIVDAADRVLGVVTARTVLSWVADGAGDPERPVSGLMGELPPALGTGTLVTDAMLAACATGAPALAVTTDGTPGGRLTALVTLSDIGRVFGDQPAAILREIARASGPDDLRALTHRSRALALQYLTSSASVDWLTRFIALADAALVQRLVTLTGDESPVSSACWCVCAAAGRGEVLTREAPRLVVIAADDGQVASLSDLRARVVEGLEACGYFADTGMPFDAPFHVASRGEWEERYRNWLYDPVRTEMYLARPFFDLRPVHGDAALWREVERAMTAAIDANFLHVLANDCLGNLPPLTFFQDAVVEKSGEHAASFRLEESALRPLVDVGRVFGMASKNVLGTSTLERFDAARALLPAEATIFREAAESLRVLLWQQGRIGISRATSGAELPPSLLSRQDRHLLKGCFRSILRLVEFTGNLEWLTAV